MCRRYFESRWRWVAQSWKNANSGPPAPRHADELARCAPRRLFLLALTAEAVDLEGVAGGEVAVFAADLFFHLFDLRGKKLHRAAAAGADHVVMAAPVVLVLVAGDAVVEGDLAGQAALGQQLQGAVDGGEADARIAALDHVVQLFGGKMLVGFQKAAQNGVALAGVLQADAL